MHFIVPIMPITTINTIKKYPIHRNASEIPQKIDFLKRKSDAFCLQSNRE
jgi:hypothetical protein